ncbi:hypothetical protein AXK60_08745 [Tsukamurella pseudospumae]|uniref:Uncharacterized protein n=1 Tax=Tsukamurella pseudospumae TaxID=239498 RepID=A0A138AEB2_9ACTN|nr:hypothetical protein AXK61_14165 [Tsukamurella pseudospumae]KXP08750.1 hypothetical protein AXK60_08745 [Tsukamurella pseudospumae]
MVTKPSATMGKILEARRLAATIPLYSTIDPALKFGNPMTIGALEDHGNAPTVESAFGTSASRVMAGHGAGVIATARNGDSGKDYGYVNFGLWEMSSPEAAAAAVADPRLLEPELVQYGYTKKSVSMQGYPKAVAYELNGTRKRLRAFLASGSVVIAVSSELMNAALVRKYFDLQLQALKDFVPTDEYKRGELPVDPSGLSALTLAPDSGDLDHEGDIAPRVIALGADSPDTVLAAFTAAGADAAGLGGTTVYRTKDAASAPALSGVLLDSATRYVRFRGTPIQVKDMDGVACSTVPARASSTVRAACTMAVGRYVAVVTSSQAEDAIQRAAAQYLILRSAK